jgi:hypothetical protein
MVVLMSYYRCTNIVIVTVEQMSWRHDTHHNVTQDNVMLSVAFLSLGLVFFILCLIILNVIMLSVFRMIGVMPSKAR